MKAGRIALVLALLRPLWRTLPWRVFGVAGAVGLGVAGTGRWPGGGPGPLAALYLLRAAALALALGVAFLLDDPARHTTAPVPARRAVRTLLRAGLVAPVAALWWAAALHLVPAAVRPPAGDITLEAGTACVLALAGAALAVRHTHDPEPGRSVAAGLLGAAVLAPLLLPARWALFTTPADPGWAAGHERWAWVLAGAAVAGALALGEPSARRTVRGPLRSPCGTSDPSRTS